MLLLYCVACGYIMVILSKIEKTPLLSNLSSIFSHWTSINMHSLSNNRNSKTLNSIPPTELTCNNDSSSPSSSPNNNNNNNTVESTITPTRQRCLPPVPPNNVQKQSSPQPTPPPFNRQSPPQPPKRTTSTMEHSSSIISDNNMNSESTIYANKSTTNNSPPHQQYHHHRTLPIIPIRNYHENDITPSTLNPTVVTTFQNHSNNHNHSVPALPIKKDPMQASTWIRGLQMVSDDSRGLLSASTLAKTTNVNNQSSKIEEEKRTSFGNKKTEISSDNTRYLPPPLKINRMESPNNDVNNELAKQLQKLKRTPATPTTSSTSNGGSGSNSSSRHSSIEIQRGSDPETSAEKKLFEVVVVVKLKQTDKLEPFIDYEFPPQNVRSTKDLKLVMSIPLFCCKLL